MRASLLCARGACLSRGCLLHAPVAAAAAPATSLGAALPATAGASADAGAERAPVAKGSGGAAFVPPYPTEGGRVPIYSMAHGLIQKRNWVFRNPDWCDLCKEPVAAWVSHQSRKDHALMDMHYTALVECPRRWNPEEVLQAFSAELGVDMLTYHARYAHHDRKRRNELYAMLIVLEEAGLLYFGESRHTYLSRMQGGLRGMDHQGALVLHRFILGPFMRLYPDAHIQDFSNLVDFVTCSYNMETVYDLCGLYTLDKVALRANYKPSSPAAVGLGGVAATSSATGGFEQQAFFGARVATSGAAAEGGIDAPANGTSDPVSAARARARAKQQEDLDEEAFSRKSAFMRQLLGQMRWLTLPGQEHPAGFTFPPHIIVLGEVCLKSLVTEIIAARVCEYMVRAEPVWRSFGFERRRLDMRERKLKIHDVVPEPVKYFYRSMSPRMDDLYATGPSMLDQEVRTRLQSKGLPIPPEFL